MAGSVFWQREAVPKLGNATKGIVVAVRADEHVGVEQVQQAPPPSLSGTEHFANVCRLDADSAALVVDSTPESIMRRANSSMQRCCVIRRKLNAGSGGS